MNRSKLVIAVVAVSAAFAAVNPAAANGSRAAVPVPVPVPVGDEGGGRGKGYYLRGTLGYTFGSAGDITSTGTDIGAYSSFNTIDGPGHVGIGFGAYINNNWRWDLTADFRPTQKVNRATPQTYASTSTQAGDSVNVIGVVNGQTLTVATPSWNVHSWSFEREDEVRAGNQTVLFNLYYDMSSFGRFTPYLGAGLGVAVTTVKRGYTETGDCNGTTTVYNDPFGGGVVATGLPVCTATPSTTAVNGSNVETGYGFAAAAMAGFSFQVAPSVDFDLGYRYIWQGSSIVTSAPAGPPGAFSRINIGDRSDHEVRASIRWNVN